MKITNLSNEKAILSEIGNRIQQYRVSMNITQAGFAKQCGISLKTIARIEKGIVEPKYLTLLRLAKAFDMKLKDLLDF